MPVGMFCSEMPITEIPTVFPPKFEGSFSYAVDSKEDSDVLEVCRVLWEVV